MFQKGPAHAGHDHLCTSSLTPPQRCIRTADNRRRTPPPLDHPPGPCACDTGAYASPVSVASWPWTTPPPPPRPKGQTWETTSPHATPLSIFSDEAQATLSTLNLLLLPDQDPHYSDSSGTEISGDRRSSCRPPPPPSLQIHPCLPFPTRNCHMPLPPAPPARASAPLLHPPCPRHSARQDLCSCAPKYFWCHFFTIRGHVIVESSQRTKLL